MSSFRRGSIGSPSFAGAFSFSSAAAPSDSSVFFRPSAIDLSSWVMHTGKRRGKI